MPGFIVLLTERRAKPGGARVLSLCWTEDGYTASVNARSVFPDRATAEEIARVACGPMGLARGWVPTVAPAEGAGVPALPW